MAGGGRPNLVIMMSDQHAPRVLGCAGDPVVRTPHLDRLAGRGVRFAAAYAGSPLCVPSRATFLTGQHCSDVGVWSNACTLPSDVPTFVHSLAAAGYETVLCGRMHFKGPDQRHGFMRRIMGDVSGPADGRPNELLGHLRWSAQGQSLPGTTEAGAGRTSFLVYDGDVTAAAVAYLHDRSALARTSEAEVPPFCLVIGWVSPHNPYIAPGPLFNSYAGSVKAPQTWPHEREREHPVIRRMRELRRTDEITPAQARTARAAYYGLVTHTDEQVGQVVAALEETGLGSGAAVFYTSDHGDMLGEHGLWQKNYLYESSVGVPLIASWPGHFASQTVVQEPVSLIDLAPTFTTLAGAPDLPHASGRALTPLLTGQPLSPDWRSEVYAESMHVQGFPPARMVRRGPWKLVRYHGHEQPQLFNLGDDPDEVNDRSEDQSCAAIRDALDALVCEGWSGTEVLRRVQRRERDGEILGAWARSTQPQQPDLWKAPPGSTVFPELETAGAASSGA